MKGAAHALPFPAVASRSHSAQAASQGAASGASQRQPVGRGAHPDAASAPAGPHGSRRAGGDACRWPTRSWWWRASTGSRAGSRSSGTSRSRGGWSTCGLTLGSPAAIEAFDRGDLEAPARAAGARSRRWCARADFWSRRSATSAARRCSTTSPAIRCACRCRRMSSRSPRFLIEAGAEVNARTLSPRNGETTMDLVLTSQHASEAGVSRGRSSICCSRTARGWTCARPTCLHRSLSNHATRAAERLIDLGAEVDVCAAAALGRMDRLRDAFDAGGQAEDAGAARDRDAVRARCHRPGHAVRVRERPARGGRLPAREGRQLEHDRRQQRHRAPPRGGRRRSPDGRAAGRRRAPTSPTATTRSTPRRCPGPITRERARSSTGCARTARSTSTTRSASD